MSKLAQALELSKEDFDTAVSGKRPKMRKALKKVIFESQTYKDAGKDCGVTPQAIYDHLKKMYKARWGMDYAG